MQKIPKKFNNWLFSDWTEVTTGVPQGLNLGLFQFNKLLNDIFKFILKFSRYNYVHGSTLYIS